MNFSNVRIKLKFDFSVLIFRNGIFKIDESTSLTNDMNHGMELHSQHYSQITNLKTFSMLKKMGCFTSASQTKRIIYHERNVSGQK